MGADHMPHGTINLSHEIKIVWEEPIERFDYVREFIDHYAGTRQRPVRWSGEGRRVGYAVLDPKAPSAPSLRSARSGYFVRRVFFLKKYDRDSEPGGTYKTGAPCEAVDPRTVAPGVAGTLTERAWGMPFKKED